MVLKITVASNVEGWDSVMNENIAFTGYKRCQRLQVDPGCAHTRKEIGEIIRSGSVKLTIPDIRS